MKRISKQIWLLGWALLALTPASTLWAAAPTSALAKLTLEDLVNAEGLSAPVLSPNGQWFALSRQGQIALFSSDGGWPSTLTTTAGGKSGLRWSPNGSEIAFASENSIWKVPAAGGPPVRLTEAQKGPGDPRNAGDREPSFSPNGKWILFETGRHGHADLAVVSEDGFTTSVLTSDSADHDSGVWSPDGSRIAFVARTPEHFSGQLFVADFDTTTGRLKGDPTLLYEAPPDRGGGWSIRRPVWSPNGKSLVVGLQNTGWNKLYLIPANGGAPKAITEGDSEDEFPVFSQDGHKLAFVSNREKPEERHIWVANADGSRPHRLVTSPDSAAETQPQWSTDGKQLYYLRATSLEPSSLAVAAADGARDFRYLAHSQVRNFEAAGFIAPEVVHYKSSDGLEIAAILYKPLGYKPGTIYPAVLWIHGGPEGQDSLSWDPWALYLAQRGFVVLLPNYRGSSGYGEKFRNLNVEDNGGGEVDDVAFGAHYLVENKLADEKRIGIGGGSHGGTMVAYEVTKRPEVFHAAIEMYGVTNRATFLERTNRNTAIRWATKMGGSPDEKPELYRKTNILPDVPKITTPLLILHGEDDPQVPPYESQQFVAALKKANKQYLYYTYPKELHGFSQREHRLDAWKKEAAFLSHYLQPEYGLSITSTADIALDDK
jgi:dipeptidyl aminopeptidase/acylaminoacyl peptidase